MKPFQQTLVSMLAASLTLGLSSCSSGCKSLAPGTAERGAASAPAPAQFYTPPGAVYDVKYTPNTVRMDFPTVQKTLRSVSPDAQVLVFDSSNPQLGELTPGKVMFLEHIGVRRVLGTQQQGSLVAVVTDEAALTDFIQDGRIEFSMPVRFGRTQTAASLPVPRPNLLADLHEWFGAPDLVYAEEENKGVMALHAKGEINNWEYELEGESEGSGISLTLDVAKKLSGLTASIKAKGDVTNISTAFKVLISNNKMQNFEYRTPLQGKLHVTWAALTSGENTGIGESRLKLPPFGKAVIDVYGLPLLFQVDEALIFKPGFGTKHDAAEGGFEMTYEGDGGLSVHGEQSAPEGKMDGDMSLEKTTSESMAAHGIVLAIDAPKVSISLGSESIEAAVQQAIPSAALEKIAETLERSPLLSTLLKKAKEDFFKIEGAAYVQVVTEFDYAASGPLSVAPCSMTHMQLLAQAGADAQLLAMKAEAPHLKLYEKKKSLRDPDIAACGEK